MWSEKRLANASTSGMNYDVAPQGKRAMVFHADASETQPT
jgi:hypothetical protein